MVEAAAAELAALIVEPRLAKFVAAPVTVSGAAITNDIRHLQQAMSSSRRPMTGISDGSHNRPQIPHLANNRRSRLISARAEARHDVTEAEGHWLLELLVAARARVAVGAPPA